MCSFLSVDATAQNAYLSPLLLCESLERELSPLRTDPPPKHFWGRVAPHPTHQLHRRPRRSGHLLRRRNQVGLDYRRKQEEII